MNIKDNFNPNYRLIKNFLTHDECTSILNECNKFGEDLWMIDFDLHYPKEKDVSPDYWTGIKDWQGMSLNLDMQDWDKIYQLDKNKYANILNLAKNQVENRFGVSVIKEQFLISRWRVGREQRPHVDYINDHEDNDFEALYSAGMNESFIKQFKENYTTKNYSTIIYLNENFSGGELYFPQYDELTISPETGMMITFKGDTHHMHGVKKINEGIRYTISIFWTEI